MIPADLVPRQLELPPKGEGRIAIFTGTALRHDRFALLIQKRFGDRVVAWYRTVPKRAATPSKTVVRPSLPRRVLNVINNQNSRRRAVQRIRRRALRLIGQNTESLTTVERRLFGAEVAQLRKGARLDPIDVSSPNAEEVVREVARLEPYLIVTLGGPIYGKALVETARGLALNQHDGWCPEYKGVSSVDWTLFHRDLARIGNTVHIVTSGMDAGPILRRSTVCLIDDDTRESIFARVVALGTDLMCESIHEILDSDQLTVFDQVDGQGKTFIRAQWNEEIGEAIDRDLRSGLLTSERQRMQRF